MRRSLFVTTVAAVCIANSACNRRLVGVLLDVPPAEEEGQGVDAGVTDTGRMPGAGVVLEGGEIPEYLLVAEDTVVPETEKTLDPDSVLKLLPRDHAGNVDWMEAQRAEVIRPRDGVDGPRTRRRDAFEFKFDFYLAGANEMFDAYFPHSAHTELMDCSQCHPRIFKTRGVEITMADVLQGRYCGECHGKVAFNPATACERCHTGMQMPADRAQAELIGTVHLRRATEIRAERGDTTGVVEGNASGVGTGAFPRAQFPHWVHRIRYRCTTCHMEIFEPKAGVNEITMVDIEEGRFCGECHNGTTAFATTITNCGRCHVPDSTPRTGG
jgi:c(7)-type cytochrome triheme protein